MLHILRFTWLWFEAIRWEISCLITQILSKFTPCCPWSLLHRALSSKIRICVMLWESSGEIRFDSNRCNTPYVLLLMLSPPEQSVSLQKTLAAAYTGQNHLQANQEREIPTRFINRHWRMHTSKHYWRKEKPEYVCRHTVYQPEILNNCNPPVVFTIGPGNFLNRLRVIVFR